MPFIDTHWRRIIARKEPRLSPLRTLPPKPSQRTRRARYGYSPNRAASLRLQPHPLIQNELQADGGMAAMSRATTIFYAQPTALVSGFIATIVDGSCMDCVVEKYVRRITLRQ
jgi:hypothetical protein